MQMAHKMHELGYEKFDRGYDFRHDENVIYAVRWMLESAKFTLQGTSQS